MCSTFQMMTLEKYLTKNFEFFLGGTPFLAPQSVASPKMTTAALPMTPPFYCRIPFYSINVDISKKLEFEVKKKSFKNFHFSACEGKTP